MVCILNFDYILLVCIYMCIYVCIYMYICMYICVYIYTCRILVAYTQCCLANVYMKHYRNHSNSALVGPLISFVNQNHFLSLYVGVANTDPYVSTLTHS